MSTFAPDVVADADRVTPAPEPADRADATERSNRASRAEILLAVGAFVALCIAVLTRATRLLEPDDYAYRASIEALAHGHITLTNSQYQALSKQLGGMAQWGQRADGTWISEKNPGYPFFAVPFFWLGIVRAAPLFSGALGCTGLFVGARRWLGRWAGTGAVILFCSSGAALVFAWRATMPTFTGAALIAAGTGTLLWVVLATEMAPRRRTGFGLLGFAALEGAAFIRYTDVLIVVVAALAILLARRSARLPGRTILWWLGSVAVLGAIVATFDAVYYGGAFKTGYAGGLITFGLDAVRPNLERMPKHLVAAMPVLVPALLAAGWIAVRFARHRHRPDAPAVRRDAAVGGALVVCWAGIFGLYAAYTWTVALSANDNAAVAVIRFYVPALAAVCLLATWLLTRISRLLPRGSLAWAALAVLVILGARSYPSLADRFGGPGGPGGAPIGGVRPTGAPPNGVRPTGPLPNGAAPNGVRPAGPLPNGAAPNGAPPGGGPPNGAPPR